MRSVTLKLLFAAAMLAMNVLSQTAQERPDEAAFVSARPKPKIYKRSELTDAQIALIEEEREINNLNVLLERPASDERAVIATIASIQCSNGRILFRFVAADRTLKFTGRSLDEIKFAVLTPGTRAFTFGCESRFPAEKVVAVYLPAVNGTSFDGVLTSVTIVPANFRLKSLDAIAREPLIIVEGMPPTDTGANARMAVTERAEMDRVAYEAQTRDLMGRLREPGPGEVRIVGALEKVECVDGQVVIRARNVAAPLVFHAPLGRKIEVSSFTPEFGIREIDCVSPVPPATAVFTYRDGGPVGSRYALIAIEFVPFNFRFR